MFLFESAAKNSFIGSVGYVRTQRIISFLISIPVQL